MHPQGTHAFSKGRTPSASLDPAAERHSRDEHDLPARGSTPYYLGVNITPEDKDVTSETRSPIVKMNAQDYQHPIFKLPEELISQILALLPEPTRPFREDRAENLKQLHRYLTEKLYPGGVCSELRRIWLSSQYCWNTIYFWTNEELTIGMGHLRLLEASLKRSRQAPLHLSIGISKLSTSRYHIGGAIRRLLEPHWERCRTFKITPCNSDMPLNRQRPLPHLRSLCLGPTHTDGIPFLDDCDHSVLQQLQLVNFLNEWAYDGKREVPKSLRTSLFVGMKELYLHGWMAPNSWCSFMEQCPNLEHVIWKNSPRWSRSGPSWNITLPQLKTLQIDPYIPNFDHFHAPNLVRLKLWTNHSAEEFINEQIFDLLPSLLVEGTHQGEVLTAARFPLLRRASIPTSGIVQRIPKELPVLWQALFSKVEELVLHPYSAGDQEGLPIAHMVYAICNLKDSYGPGMEDEGFKLRSLEIGCDIRQWPEFDEEELKHEGLLGGFASLMLDTSSSSSLGDNDIIVYSPARTITIYRAIKRFLLTFPEAHLTVRNFSKLSDHATYFFAILPSSEHKRVTLKFAKHTQDFVESWPDLTTAGNLVSHSYYVADRGET